MSKWNDIACTCLLFEISLVHANYRFILANTCNEIFGSVLVSVGRERGDGWWFVTAWMDRTWRTTSARISSHWTSKSVTWAPVLRAGSTAPGPERWAPHNMWWFIIHVICEAMLVINILKYMHVYNYMNWFTIRMQSD